MCNTSLLVSQMVSSILPWNLWQKARAAEEQVSFSCNAAADEMPFQDTASVPAVFRPCVRKGRGAVVCLPPSQPLGSLLRPRSCSHTLKQAHGSGAGAGSKLPTLAASTCSKAGITSTLNVLGPCSATAGWCGAAVPSGETASI